LIKVFEIEIIEFTHAFSTLIYGDVHHVIHHPAYEIQTVGGKNRVVKRSGNALFAAPKQVQEAEEHNDIENQLHSLSIQNLPQSFGVQTVNAGFPNQGKNIHQDSCRRLQLSIVGVHGDFKRFSENFPFGLVHTNRRN
jgi:hypothetical protein